MIGGLDGVTISAKPTTSRYSTSTAPTPKAAKPVGPDPIEQKFDGRGQMRRWESAQTNRLNEHQWTNNNAESINFDLYADYQTLVSRCRYERLNNPIVDGVCETFAIDVVGRRGPHLIVESDNEAYNSAVEKGFREWWNEITVDRQSGTQLLRRLVPQLFDCGDWLHQLVNMESELPGGTAVVTRLMDIDPIRLWDPMLSSDTLMGIQRDKYGRPKKYWIRDDVQPGAYRNFSYKYKDIPADDIIHCYVEKEPGQVRGFPRLASALQDMADLRDYDNQVLDAARAAANNGMLLYSTDPTVIEADQDMPNTPIRLERQVAKYVKGGYMVGSQASTQPGAHYIEFRHERLRSLGRCAHMPLLMVLLSAEDANFSQSRIDLNVIYQRGINSTQQWIEEEWLSVLLAIFLRESSLALKPGRTTADPDAFLIPLKPAKVSYRWGWEPIAQANPKDHLTVQTERIKWGLSSPEIELNNEGVDEDEVLDSLARSNKKRAERGLEPLPGPGITVNQGGNDNDKSNEGTNAKKQTAKSGQAASGKAGRRRSRSLATR